MSQNHLRARRLIAGRFEVPLAPREEAWLQEHLRECESCARMSELYGDAESSLYPGSGPLSLAAEDRIWARLHSEPARASSIPTPAALVGLAAMASLAAALVIAVVRPSSFPENEFQARGAEPSLQLKLRVLVIEPGPRVTELAEDSVSHGAHLAFLVSGGRGCPCSVVVEGHIGPAGSEANRAIMLAEGEHGGEGASRIGAAVAVPKSWAGQEIRLTARVPQRERVQVASAVLRVESLP